MKTSSKTLLVIMSVFYSLSVSADGNLKPLSESEMGSTVYVSNNIQSSQLNTVHNTAPKVIEAKIDESNINNTPVNTKISVAIPSNINFGSAKNTEYSSNLGFNYGFTK